MASIIDQRTFIFTSKSAETDLVEFADYLPDHSLTDREFTITKAAIKRIVKVACNRVAIVWEPQETIPLYTPYDHSCTHHPSSPYGDDAFYHAMHFDRPTGTFEVHITLPVPASVCRTTRLPMFRHAVSYRRIHSQLFGRASQFCDQPELSADRRTVTWVVVNPPLYSTFVLFVCYAGMEDVAREFCLDRMFPRSMFRSRKRRALNSGMHSRLATSPP